MTAVYLLPPLNNGETMMIFAQLKKRQSRGDQQPLVATKTKKVARGHLLERGKLVGEIREDA
jgi:hypothetical protein